MSEASMHVMWKRAALADLLICVVVICISSLAIASENAKSQNLFTTPEGWTLTRNLYGLPEMIIGPAGHHRRTVVSLTREKSQAAHAEFANADFNSTQNEYRRGREAWLMKVKGEALEFFRYRRETTAPGVFRHSIGFKYRLGNETFTEWTHFYVCSKDVVHLKTLMPSTREKLDQPSVDRILGSFRCDG